MMFVVVRVVVVATWPLVWLQLKYCGVRKRENTWVVVTRCWANG